MSAPLCDSGARVDQSPHDRLWSFGAEIPGGLPIEPNDPAPFDLHQTIDTVASDLARSSHARELTLNVRYALTAPRSFIGHGDRIRHVMMKLVGRAVDLATLLCPRGQVTIDVQGDECDDASTATRMAAMRLRVEVAGQCLSNAHPPVAAVPTSVPVRLRTRLPRLRPNGGEDKLGLVATLADCRRLVELMGGRLGDLTDPGKGSFVWLAMKLPVDASRRQQLR